MQKTQPQSKPRNSTQCRHLSVLPVWQISATISERRSRNVNIRRNSLARTKTTNALKTERERTRERAEGRETEGSRQGERLERGEAEKRLSISLAFHPICRRSPEGVGRRSKEREGGMQSGGELAYLGLRNISANVLLARSSTGVCKGQPRTRFNLTRLLGSHVDLLEQTSPRASHNNGVCITPCPF